jgi:hypothetical protein
LKVLRQLDESTFDTIMAFRPDPPDYVVVILVQMDILSRYLCLPDTSRTADDLHKGVISAMIK